MPSATRCLTALPVFNEVTHLSTVLDAVKKHACDVLVVDDGSTDGSSECLRKRRDEKGDIFLVRHPQNCGYGAALWSAFDYAIRNDYDTIVTIDCDGQHEPELIADLARRLNDDSAGGDCDGLIDIVSGSRYLVEGDESEVPVDRRQINFTITSELNERLGLSLTDAFCGFKAYRVAALEKMRLVEKGYAMPLELWVQAWHHGLRVCEAPVPLIYLDEERSFGGALDEAQTRLAYYREVINRAVDSLPKPTQLIWTGGNCPMGALSR